MAAVWGWSGPPMVGCDSICYKPGFPCQARSVMEQVGMTVHCRRQSLTLVQGSLAFGVHPTNAFPGNLSLSYPGCWPYFLYSWLPT